MTPRVDLAALAANVRASMAAHTCTDLCPDEHGQPRERPVPCSRCSALTWRVTALCDTCTRARP